MAYDPELAGRIRSMIDAAESVSERKMFGGLAFFLDGNLAVSAYRDGGLMIRCAAEDWQTLCDEAGARPMLRKGAPVSGWVLIAAATLQEDRSLQRWVERGVGHARSQPTK
jgi:TfoX/Sxy family transcriptional regulator of competence genes